MIHIRNLVHRLNPESVNTSLPGELQRFATSHYFYTGLRITFGIMVPTLLFTYFNWLPSGISFVWGALFAGLTDMAGPVHHRRNGLLVSTVLNAFTLLCTEICILYPPLVWLEIGLLGFLYSLMGIYGNRASSIGVLALVVMVLSLNPSFNSTIHLGTVGLMLSGGLWYTALSLVSYRMRPYLLTQQSMGEYLKTLGDYVKAEAAFYDVNWLSEDHYVQLMTKQVQVQQQQEQMRDLLIKTREFITDSAPKGRSLMLMFIESLDLYEHSISRYDDYQRLHKEFSGTDMMKYLYETMVHIGDQLGRIGLAVQAGKPAPHDPHLPSLIAAIRESYGRHTRLLAMGRIVNNIENMTTHMEQIAGYSYFDVKQPLPATSEVSLRRFVTQQPVTAALLLESLSLQSNAFRHAARLTIALLVGYGISFILPVSNAYWVMLTSVTILRPAYSISRKRNKDRVIGTLFGGALSFVTLYLVHSEYLLIIIMVICMVMAYSLLRLHYLGFVLFLTIYIIIVIHFLNPVDFRTIIFARLVDTIVGSAVATLASRFILPSWEYRNLADLQSNMLAALAAYYQEAVRGLLNQPVSLEEYRLTRKNANVSLANLSDAFQRMLSEKKYGELDQLAHQFVVTSHTLTGFIASLGSSRQHSLPHDWISNIASVTLSRLSLQDMAELSQGFDENAYKGNLLADQLRQIQSLAADMARLTASIRKVETGRE